ncbi:hypothetical protein ACIRG5_41445 [Lentzea sp. NPDC102401]|uniref:hypothetical protein n=1 Tax=Lentzea sp. NPDC102401 TaxID=3364128 RepID=UPI00380773A8
MEITDLERTEPAVGLPISAFDWIPTPAAHSAVTKAYESARKAGLADDMALVLAEAAMDPARLRADLGNPKQRHFDGCTITYITTDLWSPSVVPSLENVRFEDTRGHWLSAPDTKLLPRFGSAEDAAVLTLAADSPEHVVDVVSPLVVKALASNEKVKTIPLRGVEEPVMLAFARVAFRDQDPVTVLEPVDGFCRVAQTHDTLGVRLRDALVTFNVRPAERATLIKTVLGKGRDAVADPDDDEAAAKKKAVARARLRSLVLQQAVVIIGFEGPDHVPFDQARRRLVGRLHLSPPLGFTPEAVYSAKARAAVDALAARGRLPQVNGLSINQVEYALLGDATTPVPADGAPRLHTDELAALALRTMRPRAEAANNDVRYALRDLTGQLPTAPERLQVAAEIGLRAAPGITATVAQRAALARAWEVGAFSGPSWAVTRRPVTELLEEALEEHTKVRRGTMKVGPAITELAALASWYLVTADPHPLARSGFGTKRTAARGEKDNREPNTLLRAMMQDTDGIKQLAQVVYDGRAGRVLKVLPRGGRPLDIHRAEAPNLDEGALRHSVSPAARSSGGTDGAQHRTAEDDWTDAQTVVQEAAAEFHRAVRALCEVKTSSGQNFATTVGFRDQDINDHLANTQKLLHGLDFQRDRYLETQGIERALADQNDEGTA